MTQAIYYIMRKMLLILLLTSCFALVATGAMAQSENTVKNVSVMNLDYTVKEAPKSELGTVVSAVLDVLSDKTTTEEPGYADALRASVITALGNVRRFSVSDGRQLVSAMGVRSVLPTIPTSLSTAPSTTSLLRGN